MGDASQASHLRKTEVENPLLPVAEMRARVDFSVIDEWIARGAPTNAAR